MKTGRQTATEATRRRAQGPSPTAGSGDPDGRSGVALLHERHAAWFKLSTEGLFRIDVTDPLDVTASPAAQVDHLINHARLAEWNDAMLRLLRMSERRLDERIGTHCLLRSIAEIFILKGHRLDDQPIVNCADGESIDVSATAVYQNAVLVRIWGRCRPSIDEKLAARISRAVERQKQLIGLELHDGVGQLLTAVRITGHDIAGAVKDGNGTLHRKCVSLVNTVDEALKLLRGVTSDLSPASLLRGDTLKAALEDLTRCAHEVGSVDCFLDWAGCIRIPDPERRVHVYRIVQEAVNNAVKHAHARTVRVYVRRESNEMFLRIVDDGVGFSDDGGVRSLGIEGMRHRARIIGADLSIRSVVGNQTTVACRVPL